MGGAVIFVQRELRGEDEYRVVGGVARDARSDVFVVSPVGIGNELESEFVMARYVILVGTAEPFGRDSGCAVFRRPAHGSAW